MKRKTSLCTLLILFISVVSFAQLSDYNYKRQINSVTEDWHSITIPDEVFGKVKPSMNDIRIYGISKSKDTIEMPYILKVNSDQFISEKSSFEIINKSKKENGFYYTFKLETKATINSIQLDFGDLNFDWKVNLEGSQNQNEWFTLLEDYRILAIKNESSIYRFTNLVFPKANYKYYRVLVKSNKRPDLENALISNKKRVDGITIKHRVKNSKFKNDKSNKTTLFDFELEHAVPVNRLKIAIDEDYDYFRSFQIQYLKDSLKTEKGWRYNYKTIHTGTLSSLEINEFDINKVIAQKFRLTVFNNDNQPLKIESASLSGYKHELITRLTQPTNCIMAYGNPTAQQPNYDITKFKKSIPSNLKALALGNEIAIDTSKLEMVSPLFQNEWWLWAVMIIVILLLGVFTFKMLQKN